MKKFFTSTKFKKRAFTLIEMLISVFIIGLISTIILVNLDRAHDKTKDNNVKNALQGAKTASGIYYMEKANYSTFCSSPNTTALLSEMNTQGGITNCQNTADKWAIAATLPSAGNKPYPWTCLDSAGHSYEYTESVGSIVNYSCVTDTDTAAAPPVTGPQATIPTFSPVAGQSFIGQTITMTSAGADAIYYTIDGSVPTTFSRNYAEQPLTLTSNMTVQAIAVKAGYANSGVGFASYTILTVGTNYMGGRIAYIYQPGDPGYIAGASHGFVTTLSHISAGDLWGCASSDVPGSYGTALGTGQANTVAIVATCGAGTAAKMASDYSVSGNINWWLPSYSEMQKMNENRDRIGGFSATSDNKYWTSTSQDMWFVYYLKSGGLTTTVKSVDPYTLTRPISYF